MQYFMFFSSDEINKENKIKVNPAQLRLSSLRYACNSRCISVKHCPVLIPVLFTLLWMDSTKEAQCTGYSFILNAITVTNLIKFSYLSFFFLKKFNYYICKKEKKIYTIKYFFKIYFRLCPLTNYILFKIAENRQISIKNMSKMTILLDELWPLFTNNCSSILPSPLNYLLLIN